MGDDALIDIAKKEGYYADIVGVYKRMGYPDVVSELLITRYISNSIGTEIDVLYGRQTQNPKEFNLILLRRFKSKIEKLAERQNTGSQEKDWLTAQLILARGITKDYPCVLRQ